jgi:outer membrane lipoprotein-sorting protein
LLISFMSLPTVLAAASGDGAAVDTPAGSAEALVSAITDVLTSMDSISCDFSVMQRDATDKEPKVLRPRRYARAAQKWRLAEVSVPHGENASEERVTTFDGARVYSFTRSQDRDGVQRLGTVEVHDSQRPPLLSPEQLLGMNLSNLGRSIPEVCTGNHVTAESAVFDDGRNGFRLVVHSVENGRTAEIIWAYDVEFWLDPEHGMLPADIWVRFSPETNVPKSHRNWFSHWRITAYRKVMDEASGDGRWFPCEGILEQANDIPTFLISLDNIRVNLDFDPSEFSPDIPAGTTVADSTASGRGRVTVVGGPLAISDRVELLTKKARSSESPVTRRNWLIVGNLAFAIVFALFLLWKRYLSRRS